MGPNIKWPLVRTLKKLYRKRIRKCTHLPCKNRIPCIDKWLSNTNIHIKWSNLIWDALWNTSTQITQTLKDRYGRYLENYQKKHILKQNISPTCSLCASHQNDTCLHLLSCCTNRHIYNLRIN